MSKVSVKEIRRFHKVLKQRKNFRVDIRGRERQEHNDCSVVAMAVLTEKSYEDVHFQFVNAGRKYRIGTNRLTCFDAISCLGYRVVNAERFHTTMPEGETIPHYGMDAVARHTGYTMTVNRLEQYVNKRKRYLGVVNKHMFAIVGGKVQDWTRGKRNVVKVLYEVVPA